MTFPMPENMWGEWINKIQTSFLQEVGDLS